MSLPNPKKKKVTPLPERDPIQSSKWKVLPEGLIVKSRVELAKAFGVCPRTISRWRQKGLIPFVVKNGNIRYRTPEVSTGLAENPSPKAGIFEGEVCS